MKKLLAYILTGMMICSLAACGGETGPQPTDDTVGENEETILTDWGFQDTADAQDFVDHFNSSTGGYAYMVESDAETYEGSLQELGYSVYRILIWNDKDAAGSLGDFEGKSPENNMNIRLIYNPEGQLVLLKALFTISNSAQVAKTNDALSCDAMTELLSALFPGDAEEQTQELYHSLQLPTIEQIDSYEPKVEYDSTVDLIEHFLTHCGYTIDSDAGDLPGAFLQYDCNGQEYRLICTLLGEHQNDLYAIYWDISFVSFDDTLMYESIVSIPA